MLQLLFYDQKKLNFVLCVQSFGNSTLEFMPNCVQRDVMNIDRL